MIDVSIYCPFLFFPAWYISRQILLEQQMPAEATSRGLERWGTNLTDDALATAAVWLPLHYLNFRYVSIKYRLPFMAGGGLVYSFVLSKMQFDNNNNAQ